MSLPKKDLPGAREWKEESETCHMRGDKRGDTRGDMRGVNAQQISI